MESPMHRNAKREIIVALNGRESIIASVETMDGWRTYRIDVAGSSLVEECSYPNIHSGLTGAEYFAEYGEYPSMIFDVGIVIDGMVIGCIEVLKSHWLDDRKRAKIRSAGLFCVAVPAKTGDWLSDECRLDARELILPTAVSGRVSALDAMVRA